MIWKVVLLSRFRPMCFSNADADFLCEKLETVIKELQNEKEEQKET
jgi:hypothetical protein